METILPLRSPGAEEVAAPLPRTRSNIFLRRSGRLEFMKAGMRYRSRRGQGTIETARVLCFLTDAAGIAHVCFEAGIERPSLGRIAMGPRLLSLSAFAERFPERS